MVDQIHVPYSKPSAEHTCHDAKPVYYFNSVSSRVDTVFARLYQFFRRPPELTFVVELFVTFSGKYIVLPFPNKAKAEKAFQELDHNLSDLLNGIMTPRPDYYSGKN